MSEAQWRATFAAVWHRMADAGYQSIMLPIIPPWAKIAPGLKIEAGKSPGHYNPISKDWGGMPKWQHHMTTAGDIAEWSTCPDCPSIGIRLGTLIAFDMDVIEDDDRARKLAIVVRDHLATWAGTPHLRTRVNSVRWAAVYQAEADALNMAKQVIRFLDATTRTQLGKLELLANGQQIVVQGVHTSGALLDWPIRQLGNLPRIDRTQITMYLEALAAVLAPLGIVVERGKHSAVFAVEGRRLPIGDPSLKATSLDALAMALRFIDNAKLTDYNRWFTVLAAIKGACAGQSDFIAGVVVPWAMGYPGNTPEMIIDKLDSISDTELGATFLDRLAREGGYRGPPLAGEFNVVPTTEGQSSASVPAVRTTEVRPALPDDWIAAPAADLMPITPQASAETTHLSLAEGFDSAQHLYCTDARSWVIYDDVFGTWQFDSDGDTTTTDIQRHLRSLGHSKLVTLGNAMAVRKTAQGLDKFKTLATSFDADPLWLNTPNGVVDLRPDGITLVHSPGYRHFMRTNIAPEFGATGAGECPLFEQCCLEWADDDGDLAQTILSIGASLLFGDPPGQYLINLHGTGRNGKSLFMAIMKHIMGTTGGYFGEASTATISSFERSGSAARSDIAALHRKRVVFVSEYQNRRLNVGMIKAWTGGDGLTAREVYSRQRDSETVQPGRLVLCTNHALELPADDPAMNARLRLIPWRRQFEDDPTMLLRLKAEAPGILARLIHYGRLMHGEMHLAESVIEATDEALDQLAPARRLVRAALKPAEGSGGPELTLDAIVAHVRDVVPILFPGDQHVAGLMMHDNPTLGSIVLRNYAGKYQRSRRRAGDRRPVSYVGIALRDPMDVWTNG